jgi:hypothetical protein
MQTRPHTAHTHAPVSASKAVTSAPPRSRTSIAVPACAPQRHVTRMAITTPRGPAPATHVSSHQQASSCSTTSAQKMSSTALRGYGPTRLHAGGAHRSDEGLHRLRRIHGVTRDAHERGAAATTHLELLLLPRLTVHDLSIRSRADMTAHAGSILPPGQGWYRSAKAQNSTKAPLTGAPKSTVPTTRARAHLVMWQVPLNDAQLEPVLCDGVPHPHDVLAVVQRARDNEAPRHMCATRTTATTQHYNLDTTNTGSRLAWQEYLEFAPRIRRHDIGSARLRPPPTSFAGIPWKDCTRVRGQSLCGPPARTPVRPHAPAPRGPSGGR